MMKDKPMKPLLRMTLAAMFLALGMILPYFTGQIQVIGSMLLPMHIPVILCGLICGWKYGLAVGIVLPLLRSVTLGMPPLFPMALGMAIELGVYGFVSGWLYSHSKYQCVWALYKCLIAAMIAGRLAYGLYMTIVMSALGQPYSLQIFLTSTIVNGLPGIVLQLVLIPAVMVLLNRTGLVRFSKASRAAEKA